MKHRAHLDPTRSFRCAAVAFALLASLLAAEAAAATEYRVFGGVLAAEAVPQGTQDLDHAGVLPLTLKKSELIPEQGFVATQDLAMVRVEAVDVDGTVLDDDVAPLGGFFLQFSSPSSPPLSVRFRVYDAATDTKIHETGEVVLGTTDEHQVGDGFQDYRRYLLVPADGEQVGGSIPHPQGKDAFLLTRIGALAPETDVVAGYAYPHQGSRWQKAPFGGRLDLFGAASFKFYPPGGDYCYKVAVRQGVNKKYLDDPLFKTRYTLRHQGGKITVEAQRVQLGPFTTAGGVEHCYRFTPISGPPAGGEQVFWSYPDLLLRWNTRDMTDGLHDLELEIYPANSTQPVSLAAVTKLPLVLDNEPVTVRIDDVSVQDGSTTTVIGKCEQIDLRPGPPKSLVVDYTVQDPGDHLAMWELSVSRNDVSGATPWAGEVYPVPGTSKDVPVPGSATHTQLSGTGSLDKPCVYTVRLTASKRTTDGYGPIFHASAADARYIFAP